MKSITQTRSPTITERVMEWKPANFVVPGRPMRKSDIGEGYEVEYIHAIERKIAFQ
jgi:hypothetical protein